MNFVRHIHYYIIDTLHGMSWLRDLVWGPDHQEEEGASSISDDSEEWASALSSESQDTDPGDAGAVLHPEDR